VLFVNGLAIDTLELKNPWTNQTVYHAKKQYKEARNPREPLLQFAQNRRIALEQLIQQAISQERRRELDLYKRYASDPEFKRAFDVSIMKLLSQTDPQQLEDLYV
jgi:hypothetical protein